MLVCLECWEVFDRDVMNRKHSEPLWCPKKSCGSERVVELDECLIPVIKELNEKGYFTQYCCSGHFWEYNPDHKFNGGTYIFFEDSIKRKDLPTLPPGFVMDADDSRGATIRKRYAIKDPMELHVAVLKASIDLTKWAKGLDALCEE